MTAVIGGHTASAAIVVAPRNVQRGLEVVAHIPTKDPEGKVVQTSEEWVVGNHLYVATMGDRLYAYDVSDPAHPKALDSLKADARLYNDVSTTPDEKVGVFTREGASNRKNGIVLFDASDPAHLKVISEYTETVTGGVHSAFINSHYAYITDDATGSLRVIDFADAVHPKEVARWQTEKSQEQMIASPLGEGMISTGRYLHDLYVKDGLAYLAYWRDGLVILDVGNGIRGGSPENPKLVAQYKFNHYELYGDGWLAGSHTAFRYKNYVFVGDEVFPGYFEISSKERIPVRGILHVMDVTRYRASARGGQLRSARRRDAQRVAGQRYFVPGRLRGRRTRGGYFRRIAREPLRTGPRDRELLPRATRMDIARICRSHGARSQQMD